MKKYWILFVTCLFIFSGCASQNAQVDEGNDVPEVDYTILEPVASGEVVYSFDNTTIDASHMNDGYIMIKNEGSEKRLKVRIIHDDQMYTYEIPTNGEYDVYPLQMGDGLYEVRLYQNTSGSSYVVTGNIFLNVELVNQNVVFLYPNQYVWYTNYDHAVELSFEICEGCSTDEQKLDAIFNYVISHMSYDKEKAANIRNGYIPDVDTVLAEGKGICFDYAAIMGAMLRAQEIPCRLVVGEVMPEYVYHAWNHVLMDGTWRTVDATFANSHSDDSYTENKRY